MKDTSNIRKHGVSFETALRVFADPLLRTEPERVDRGEERWHTIGRADGHLVLLVIHTVTDVVGDQPVEIIRIISARQLDPKERRQYEHENGSNGG